MLQHYDISFYMIGIQRVNNGNVIKCKPSWPCQHSGPVNKCRRSGGLPNINSRFIFGTHHGVSLPGARLPIGQDADVKPVSAGGDNGEGPLKHFLLEREEKRPRSVLGIPPVQNNIQLISQIQA